MFYNAAAAVLPLLLGRCAAVLLGGGGSRHALTKAGWTKVEAYYVNRNDSHERASCMESQLLELQTHLRSSKVELGFHRWPAVELHRCQDVAKCMRRYPECFPTQKSVRITHPNTERRATAIQGILGNWCAHLNLLSKLREHKDLGADYYFVLEDDIIMDTPKLAKSLVSLLQASRHHWPLVAFDTFASVNDPNKSPPKEDLSSGGLKLYSISHAWGYYGAHAWLLDAVHSDQFAQFVSNLHTVPVDWVPKVEHPLHLGMMSYQTGAVTQKVLLTHAEGTAGSKEMLASCLEAGDSDILGRRALGRSATFYHTRPLLASDAPEINKVAILGMHDTGTRLLYGLFHHAFEKPQMAQLCTQHTESDSCGGVWKHTNPSRLLDSQDDLGSALALVVVRHPFSQLKSRRAAAPHHSWGSLAEAWNKYMAGYLKLDSVFNKVAILRYEDLVESPENAMQEVGAKLSKQFHSISENSWLGSPEHTKAIAKLKARDYMSGYTDQDMKELCGALDKGILFQLGYHGCQDSHVTMYDNIVIDNSE